MSAAMIDFDGMSVECGGESDVREVEQREQAGG